MENDILKAFGINGKCDLTVDGFYNVLSKQGISKDDPRLKAINDLLAKDSVGNNGNTVINPKQLTKMMEPQTEVHPDKPS